VFDYIPFPVLTHTTGMTHFQNLVTKSTVVTLNCVIFVVYYELVVGV